MFDTLNNRKIFIGLSILIAFLLSISVVIYKKTNLTKYSNDYLQQIECSNRTSDQYDYHQFIDFENFDYMGGTDHFIVPNIVHLIYLGKSKFSFNQMISFYSIILNQNPDKIYIHCDDCEFNDRFWSTINGFKCLSQRVVFKKLEKHNTIFGVKVKYIEHR